jgi:hypothetical protein
MIILVQPVCVGRKPLCRLWCVVVALERSYFGTVVALSSALLVGKAR